MPVQAIPKWVGTQFGKIEAKLNNGVLRLRIPKAEEAKPRRITVNVG